MQKLSKILFFCLIVLSATQSIAQQTDSLKTKNEDIRNEAIEMRLRLNDYVSKQLKIIGASDSNLVPNKNGKSLESDLEKKKYDSLLVLSQIQRLTIDSLLNSIEKNYLMGKNSFEVSSNNRLIVLFESNSYLLSNQNKKYLNSILQTIVNKNIVICKFK